MPNHVTTTCAVHGAADDVQAFADRVITIAPADHSDAGDKLFSFDAIIPMPPILREVEESSHAEQGMALIIGRGSRDAPFSNLGLYPHEIAHIRREAGLPIDAHISDVAAAFLAENPDFETKGSLRLRAICETKFASWYPWALANWGTKWGAYQYVQLANTPFKFQFETAWSFPTPIFEALSSQFPTLAFECATFDEGWNFAGTGWFNGGPDRPSFAECKATDELYREVYGQEPSRDDDEEDAD